MVFANPDYKEYLAGIRAPNASRIPPWENTFKPEFHLHLPASIFCGRPIRENQTVEFNLKQGESHHGGNPEKNCRRKLLRR
jgi:hypothetical protein